MNKKYIAIGAAILTTFVTTTTFVVFSLVMIPKLAQLSDKAYIEKMQDINRDIQNPWFLGSFMGAVILVPLAAYLFRKTGSAAQIRLLVAASLLYIIGTFGITSAVNVPLNEKLDTVSTATSLPGGLSSIRASYETSWNKWHTVRTMASVGALVALVGVIAIKKQPLKENKEQ